jgi:hypothetical protein
VPVSGQKGSKVRKMGYGQKELGMILKALQKLDEAYRKR